MERIDYTNADESEIVRRLAHKYQSVKPVEKAAYMPFGVFCLIAIFIITQVLWAVSWIFLGFAWFNLIILAFNMFVVWGLTKFTITYRRVKNENS